MTRHPLFVVPCSARKAMALLDGPMLAREAYTGAAFRLCRAMLESAGCKWCILSGLYGFLWPTTFIEWYDVKMTPLGRHEPWDECFGHITNRQYATLRTASSVSVLGSRLYCDAAEILLGRPVRRPLAGLPIGRMLSALRWLTLCNPQSG